MAYRIEYSRPALDHMRGLPAKDRKIVVEVVKEQLTHQPAIPTRNRKPMRDNPLGQWELRIGSLRVYFTVREDSDPMVLVTAVGIKDRDVVWIGGEAANL